MDIEGAAVIPVRHVPSTTPQDRGISADRGSIIDYPLLLIALLSALLCLPSFNAIYWTGDEGVMLDGAQRLLQGDRLYADFFSMAPPGGYLLTEAWFAIFGISLFSARILAASTIIAITCLVYLCCRRASGNAGLAGGIAIGWLVATLARPQMSMMTVNHHWLTTLFSMLTAWASVSMAAGARRSLRWPLAAGLAAGTGLMIIETCGLWALIAGLVTVTSGSGSSRSRFRIALVYLVGCLAAPAMMLGYVIARHTLAVAFDDVILIALHQYASIQPVPFGEWSTRATWPLEYLYPLVASVVVILGLRDERAGRREPMLLSVAAFALAGFLASLPRPDIFHIAFTAPLACPSLAYCSVRIVRNWHPRYRNMVIAASLALCLPALGKYSVTSVELMQRRTAPTPRGDAVFIGQPGTAEILARIAASPSGDRFFFYPYMPMMPFLAARPQVSKLDLFTPNFTLPSQYRDTCLTVMREATWVVIDRHWMDPNWLTFVFPALKNPRPEETRLFEEALEAGFAPRFTSATLEIWHRRENAKESLCTRISG